MGLLEPILGESEFGSEVRLPEGNVADPPNAKHGDELATFLLEVCNLCRVVRQ
jgi:hypothetical protein